MTAPAQMVNLGTVVLGQGVRCSVTFTSGGVATDPTTVTFQFLPPGGSVTTYLYGVNGQILRDATGQYHVDLTGNVVGRWALRFAATGAVTAAVEGEFDVLPSMFG